MTVTADENLHCVNSLTLRSRLRLIVRCHCNSLADFVTSCLFNVSCLFNIENVVDHWICKEYTQEQEAQDDQSFAVQTDVLTMGNSLTKTSWLLPIPFDSHTQIFLVRLYMAGM